MITFTCSVARTLPGQTCYIGSVSEELDKATPSLGYWYLNLSSVSSCSGKLEEYEVNYYYSSNFDGNYYVHVAMWEPGENNTSYTMVSNMAGVFVTVDCRRLCTHDVLYLAACSHVNETKLAYNILYIIYVYIYIYIYIYINCSFGFYLSLLISKYNLYNIFYSDEWYQREISERI